MILITIRRGMITSVTSDTESERAINVQIADFDSPELTEEYVDYNPDFLAKRLIEIQNEIEK